MIFSTMFLPTGLLLVMVYRSAGWAKGRRNVDGIVRYKAGLSYAKAPMKSILG